MIMAGFTIKRIIHTPADLLWEQLSNFSEPASPALEVVIERPGDPASHQVGAIRHLFIGGNELREKLLRVDPQQRSFSYQLLSGAPVTNYRGTVIVREHNRHSSLVEWRVTFNPVFPWPARVIAWLGRQSVDAVLDELEKAREAETLPAG